MADGFELFDDDETPTEGFSPNPAEYFHLTPESLEWIIILQRLLKRVGDGKPLDFGDAYLSPGDNTTYMTFNLRKSKFPAKLIADTIGASEDAVAKSTLIKLRPLAQPESAGLPVPTVDYWGIA